MVDSTGAAEGYRTTRDSHHYRAIQSLTFTLGLGNRTITQLDAFRKKRNIGEYERSGGTSDQEAREMISLAARLREELLRWLKKEHLELVPKCTPPNEPNKTSIQTITSP